MRTDKPGAYAAFLASSLFFEPARHIIERAREQHDALCGLLLKRHRVSARDVGRILADVPPIADDAVSEILDKAKDGLHVPTDDARRLLMPVAASAGATWKHC